MSVASVALRGEATGVATGWNADVVATAKRDLQPGEMLDGEGGYTVWGKLLPAATLVAPRRPAARPGARREGDAAGEEGPEPELGRRGDGHRRPRPTRCAARWSRCSRAPLLKTASDRPPDPRRRSFDGTAREPHARRRRRRRRPDRRASRRRVGDADAARIVEADGLALMPGIIDSHTHFDAQITWDPDAVRPSPALGVTTAVIGNCGFTIAPCQAGRPRHHDAQPDAGRGHVARRAAARHRLGLRDLPEYLAQLRAQRQRGQRRRVRRPLSRAHLRDGRRRVAARGHATPRSRRCRRSSRDAMARRRRRLREQHVSPAHNGEGGLPMPSRLADDREMRGAGQRDGRGGRGVYMLTKGGHTPVPFLESLAADSGRPVMIAALLHNSTNPQAVFDDLDAIAAAQRARPSPARPGVVLPADDGLHAARRRIRSKGSRAGSRRSACTAMRCEALLAEPGVSRRRARRAGDADAPSACSTASGTRCRWSKPRGRRTQRYEQRSHRRRSPRERGRDPLDAMLDLALAEDLQTVFTAQLLNTRRGCGRPHAQPPAQHRQPERRRRAPDLLQRRRLRPAPARPLGARARARCR